MVNHRGSSESLRVEPFQRAQSAIVIRVSLSQDFRSIFSGFYKGKKLKLEETITKRWCIFVVTNLQITMSHLSQMTILYCLNQCLTQVTRLCFHVCGLLCYANIMLLNGRVRFNQMQNVRVIKINKNINFLLSALPVSLDVVNNTELKAPDPN